jgi:hypothetical protein
VVLGAFLWQPRWAAVDLPPWVGLCAVVGGLVSWASYRIIKREALPPALCVVAVLGLTNLAYLAFYLTMHLSGGPATSRIAAGSWRKFTPPEEALFEVELPGTPLPEQPADDRKGMPDGSESWKLELKQPSWKFIVGCDARALGLRGVSAEQCLEELRQMFLGRGATEKRVWLQGDPDWEWSISGDEKGEQRRGVIQAYAINERIYLLGVEGATVSAESPDVRRFLGSFRLLENARIDPRKKIKPFDKGGD